MDSDRPPRYWFSKHTEVLRKCGFRQSYADYSLLTYHKDDIFLCVLFYIDDLLITGNSLSSVLDFKTYLSSCFYMKDLRVPKIFLRY